MNLRSLLSIAAIVSAVAFPSAAFAQQEHMISGKAVPANQVAEVQAKCDELHKATPAATTAAKPAAPAATTAAKPAAGATAAEGWMSDGSKIDLAKLTVKLCDEGKFMAAK
jgi:hypothetical protein